MDFEVDVSGEDLLSRDFVVCLASKDGITIKGFKTTSEIVEKLALNHRAGKYRYDYSKKGKANLKIRLYCGIVYYLVKSTQAEKVMLLLCKDFDGREDDIKNALNYLLESKLGLNVEGILFSRLEKDALAHKYAYLMRKDSLNQMKTYINISFQELEEFVKTR